MGATAKEQAQAVVELGHGTKVERTPGTLGR